MNGHTQEAKRDVIIDCRGVGKIFATPAGDNHVVEGFDLTVRENEFVVLFGQGQCGKTTLLNMITGLELPTSGEIAVDGKAVTGPDTSRGMVYQTTALFPWFTVMRNVDFGPRMKGLPKAERREKAQKYIDLVGLTGFEKHHPVKLSGGMQQRVGIARAYCNDPTVICMDEPFGHLDAQTRYLMEEEVERICSTDKRTVVFVTNNAEEAIYLADRIVILTPCPTRVYKEYTVDIPRPRSYVSDDFLALRERITRDLEEQFTEE